MRLRNPGGRRWWSRGVGWGRKGRLLLGGVIGLSFDCGRLGRCLEEVNGCLVFREQLGHTSERSCCGLLLLWPAGGGSECAPALMAKAGGSQGQPLEGELERHGAQWRCWTPGLDLGQTNGLGGDGCISETWHLRALRIAVIYTRAPTTIETTPPGQWTTCRICTYRNIRILTSGRSRSLPQQCRPT